MPHCQQLSSKHSVILTALSIYDFTHSEIMTYYISVEDSAPTFWPREHILNMLMQQATVFGGLPRFKVKYTSAILASVG